MTAPKFPPRVWIDKSDLEKLDGLTEMLVNPSALDFGVPFEYISAPEVEALLREERLKAFEEAAHMFPPTTTGRQVLMKKAQALRAEGNE